MSISDLLLLNHLSQSTIKIDIKLENKNTRCANLVFCLNLTEIALCYVSYFIDRNIQGPLLFHIAIA